jgi:quercetin dioxygenase-like cupin family protein
MSKLFAVAFSVPAVLGLAVATMPGQTAAQSQEKFVVDKVAEKPLQSLPDGDLYWTAETFPSLDEANAAVGDASVAAEVGGKAWLFTIGPEDKVGHGGAWVASVGPIDRFEAPEYMMRINTSDAPPGTQTSVHSHPGSEAMHVLSGEVTVRWPDKTSVIKAGESSAGQPPHTTMQATSTGDEDLKEVIMFLVDPTQEFAHPEHFD